MSKKDTFNKMYELHTAITDIDKIMSRSEELDQNGDTKLDAILVTVQNIPKKDYDKQLANNIANGIRSAILDMYNRTASELNGEINKSTVITRINNQFDCQPDKIYSGRGVVRDTGTR